MANYSIATVAFSAKNATSRISAGSYTTTYDGLFLFDLTLTGLAATASTLTVDLVVTRSSNDYGSEHFSSNKFVAADTRIAFAPAFALSLMNGDVVEMFVESSNSSDTSIGGEIGIRDGQYVTALGSVAKTDVNTEANTALADYDPPTSAEMDARTLLAANYFDPAADTVASVTTVTGSVGSLVGHTVQTGDNYARIGTPVGADISADIAAVKAETVLIVADTGELQTDWANGGRLDLLVDGIKSKTDQLTFTAGDVHSSVTDKAGFELAANGLDTITVTEPTGKPTTFRGWLMWLVQRSRATSLSTATNTLLVKTEAGATVTTQAITDDGTTQEVQKPV